MASLNDARFSLPDVDVAVAQVTEGVDTSIASAIQAFGQIGGEARKGFLEGKLLNDLQETGNIIDTINEGPEAIGKAQKAGQLDVTSKKFQALAFASEQGKISEQRAAIEAEVLLRESISRAPGFADSFRKTAKQALGFDPSGASLSAQFLSGPDTTTTRVTTEQKDLEDATSMFNNGSVSSVESGMRLINDSRVAKLRESTMSRRISNGEVGSGKVAVEGANRMQAASNDIMLAMVQQVRETGGVQDIEALKAGVIARREQVKSKIENEMANNADSLYDPAAYNTVRDRIDQVAEANITLLETQDFQKVLARHQDILQNLSEVAAVSVATDLAILAPFGEEMMSSYLELQAQSEGDPRIMAELIATDPQYKFVGDIIMKTEHIAPALKAIADRTLGQAVRAGTIDETTAQAVVRKRALDVTTGKADRTKIDIAAIVEAAQDSKMPITGLSVASQTPDLYSRQDEVQRAATALDLKNQVNLQSANLASALAPHNLQLAFDGQQYVVIDPLDRDPTAFASDAPQAFASESARQNFLERELVRMTGTANALDMLNTTLLPVMSDSRYAQLNGFADGNDYATKIVNRVNFEGIQQSLASDLSGTSAISQIIPPKVRNELRAAFAEGDIAKARDLLADVDDTGVFNRVTGIEDTAPEGAQPDIDRIGLVNGSQIPLEAENQLEADIMDQEGVNTGSDGRTVGIGRDLVSNPLSPAERKQFGIPKGTFEETAAFLNENPDISIELARQDIAKARADIERKLPKFKALNEERQDALVNLAYNMGADGILAFPAFMAALGQREGDPSDFTKVALELVRNEKILRDKNGKAILDENGERQFELPTVTKYVRDVKPRRAAFVAAQLFAGKRPTAEEVQALADKIQEVQDAEDKRKADAKAAK